MAQVLEMKMVADTQFQERCGESWTCLNRMQPKPPLSSWLRKRKSGASMSRILRESNWRLFTLDYEAKIVYYSHTESGKSVSFPFRFSDLLGVDDLSDVKSDCLPNAEELRAEILTPAIQRSYSASSITSKISNSSGFRRLASLSGSTSTCGFRLRTQTKSMDLLCSSAAEVDTWISELTSAIAIGAEQRIHSGHHAEYFRPNMHGEHLRLAAQAA